MPKPTALTAKKQWRAVVVCTQCGSNRHMTTEGFRVTFDNKLVTYHDNEFFDVRYMDRMVEVE